MSNPVLFAGMSDAYSGVERSQTGGGIGGESDIEADNSGDELSSRESSAEQACCKTSSLYCLLC